VSYNVAQSLAKYNVARRLGYSDHCSSASRWPHLSRGTVSRTGQ